MKVIDNCVIALIPARSGSKGIPNKNIRPLAGHPLLAWSIFAAQKSRYISRIIVSTDSEKYAKIARQYGAETPFLRPAELATDRSQDIEFFLHALHWLQEHEGAVPEYLVHLRPTSPLRKAEIIDAGIEKIMSAPDATSLCSAHEVAHPPCKYFKMNEDGTFSGLMGEEYVSLPRQECPQAYQANGYVDILKSEHILSTKNLYGSKRLAFFTAPAGDIDNEDEFIKFALQMETYENTSHSEL